MKEFISLFLMVSVLVLTEYMVAKDRKGAELTVQKKNGQQVEGELIIIKQEALLLLERGSGIDVSVDIRDIEALVINKKSKALSGIGIGFLIGACSGALIGFEARDTEQPSGWFNPTPFWYTAQFKAALFGALVGVLGAIIGGTIGVGLGEDEAIEIGGKSDSEIREILEKLRKKSRIPDYP